MNAANFFSMEQFNLLRRDMDSQTRISGKYKSQVKTNGNTYTLDIYGSFFVVDDCSYFCSCGYNYNYAGSHDREIGGGSGPSVLNCKTYDDFCEVLNKLLCKFPDYTEPQPTQLSLW